MHEGAWSPGQVAIFEGIERAREECEAFYERKVAALAEKEAANPHATQEDLDAAQQEALQQHYSQNQPSNQNASVASVYPALPEGCEIYTSEPIIDRRSIFVGHACRLRTPSEVGQVVAYLLSDKKIAKAHHPAMLAYRCRGEGEVIHQDNDDDVRALLTMYQGRLIQH